MDSFEFAPGTKLVSVGAMDLDRTTPCSCEVNKCGVVESYEPNHSY